MTLPTRKLSDLLPLVLPHAPLVPHPTAEENLRLAAREFCMATRCWRMTFTETIATQGQALASIPAWATLFDIESAFFADRKLDPKAYRDLTPLDLADTNGPPSWISQANPNTVTLVPFATGPLMIVGFMAPASAVDKSFDPSMPIHDRNNVIPEFLYDLYGQEIAHGALAKILAIPGASFDPDRAKYFGGMFEKAKGNFTIGSTGQHGSKLRVKPQWM